MEIAVKIFQSLFYVIASTIAILTYLKAKDGLLNSVNTEYQKKVMEKLAQLSEEIVGEFDFSSKNHHSKDLTFGELVSRVNRFAKENKEEMLAGNLKFIGTPATEQMIVGLTKPSLIETDPFIPSGIRAKLTSFYKMKYEETYSVYREVILEYQNALENGDSIWWRNIDSAPGILRNRVNDILDNRGIGLSKLKDFAHEIRNDIKKYYDNFNPI